MHRRLNDLRNRLPRLAAVGLAVTVSACASTNPSFPAAATRIPGVTAIVGATVIDGTGAAPLQNATVILRGKRIERVGSARTTKVPPEAAVIDGRGLFVLPGFIDANVHLAMSDTNRAEVMEGARRVLKSGVTTLRDSYGFLKPLQTVRDSIDAGHEMGPRLLVAGNIVGWGGPGSLTFSPYASAGSFPMEAAITQGAGEDLVNLDVDSLRVRIKAYLEKGVDFIKYGATVHSGDDDGRFVPNLIVFSERAQRVIVEEAHRRGLVAETHATSPEGLRMALRAGVDLVQHPEVMSSGYVLSDELIRQIVRRKVICAIIGERAVNVSETYPTTRRNAEKLIEAGCVVAVTSDNAGGRSTLAAIRALVTLGMTPMDALVAATRNGALACRMLDQFGTVGPGKLADLVILRSDPLADIRNVTERQIAMVFKEGAVAVTVTPDEAREAARTEFLQKAEYVWQWFAPFFHELSLTEAQKVSLGALEATHQAQRTTLIDSLHASAVLDSATSYRRALEMFAEHLGASRRILTTTQHAAFDVKARAWLQQREMEGEYPEISGVR